MLLSDAVLSIHILVERENMGKHICHNLTTSVGISEIFEPLKAFFAGSRIVISKYLYSTKMGRSVQ